MRGRCIAMTAFGGSLYSRYRLYSKKITLCDAREPLVTSVPIVPIQGHVSWHILSVRTSYLSAIDSDLESLK